MLTRFLNLIRRIAWAVNAKEITVSISEIDGVVTIHPLPLGGMSVRVVYTIPPPVHVNCRCVPIDTE